MTSRTRYGGAVLLLLAAGVGLAPVPQAAAQTLAAGERALKISRIKRIEEIQHALPVKILDHVFSPVPVKQAGSETVLDKRFRLPES